MDIGVIQAIIGLGGTPVIIGLVEVFKKFCGDGRFYSIVAILLGLIINLVAALVLAQTQPAELFVAVILGLMAGLSASGLFSGYEAVRGK